MTTLPAGEVAFLFTDIQGSTRLWEADEAAMWRAVDHHNRLMRQAIAANDGVAFKTIGDAFQAAFASASNAVAAAVAAQRLLAGADWDETGPLLVRMAVHTGPANPINGDYLAPCLNRLARLLSTGYGGQVLLSDVVRRQVEHGLPAGVTLRDLGQHRLRDLLEPERVAQLAIAGFPDRFPPLKSLERHPTNLPIQPTPLIGRDDDIQRVIKLIASDDVRLLTMTGPAGAGKTRLALQVGADLLDQFVDGVFFVDLAPLTDPDLLLSTVAQHLGVRESGRGTLRDGLIDYLDGKRLLLILDNLEHLVAAAKDVAGLLASCAGLVVVVTSREPLRLRGEREYPVAPLPLPSASQSPHEDASPNAAIELFVQRAKAVRPAFTLTAGNAPAIVAICRLTDGLPLAIELAATQVKALSPAAILQRLTQHSPLAGLVGGARDLPERHQTLRGAIAWSHELLAPAEKTVFRRLAVFAGGCDLATAEAVIGGCQIEEAEGEGDLVLESLFALVDKSLLRQSETEDGGTRYTMLESIRAFAAERLDAEGERVMLRRQHAEFFRRLCDESAPYLVESDVDHWLNRLERDHDNLRAALDWVWSEHQCEEVGTFTTGLARFWLLRGHLSEGRRWLARALECGDSAPSARLSVSIEAGILATAQSDFAAASRFFASAQEQADRIEDRDALLHVLSHRAGIALAQGDLDLAEILYTQSLNLANEKADRWWSASILSNLGAVSHYRGDLAKATEHYSESLTIWRGLLDKHGTATALFNLAVILVLSREERERARAYGQESLRLAREIGDRQGIAHALEALGLIAEVEEDSATAAAHHEASLTLFREIDDRDGVARSSGNLGLVVLDQGDVKRAAQLCRDSLQWFDELGEQDGIAIALDAVAAVATALGKHHLAVCTLGTAAAVRDAIGVTIPEDALSRHRRLTADLDASLGTEVYTRLWEEGRSAEVRATIDDLLLMARLW